MKKNLMAILFPAAFLLGVNCSDEIKGFRTLLNEKISETGYERPYSLRIITVNRRDGINTYLYDPVSGESKRILNGMDIEREYNMIDAAFDIYGLIK